jgi:hypothetical protein
MIPVLLSLISCSGPGGGSGGSGMPGNIKKPIGGNCEINVPGSATNIEIAIAFNQWRDRCAPSDELLEKALKTLE